MDNLFENEVQIKALNGQVEEELIFPKTKVGLVKDLNSFSKFKIGDNGVTAVGYDSTLEFIAGNGINIISNNVLKNINISIDFDSIYTKDEINEIILNINSKMFENYKFDNTIDLAHVLSK